MQLIDRCAHMQNLREAILSYRRGLTHEADEARREAALHRGIQYLERYFTLCAFAAYVHDPSFTAASSAAADGSFQAWMGRRPELQSILRRLLWRNPMGALTQPGVQQAVSAALPHHADSGEVADAVVTGRAGAVLGAHCILKEEPYPGVHVSSLPVLHEGAPNFRQVRLSPARATRSTRLNSATLSLHTGVASRRLWRRYCNDGWHPRRAHRDGRRRRRASAGSCEVVQPPRRGCGVHQRDALCPTRGHAAAGQPA